MPMDDEDRRARQQEVYAGQRMSEFLNDSMMQDHLNGLLHGYQNQWLDAVTTEGREELWMRARALRDFIESLQSVVNTGDLAAWQLNQERESRNDR